MEKPLKRSNPEPKASVLSITCCQTAANAAPIFITVDPKPGTGRTGLYTIRLRIHFVVLPFQGVITKKKKPHHQWYVYRQDAVPEYLFIGPDRFGRQLALIILAVAFLGERVGWRRTSATLVGFLGVVVMLRPGHGAFDPALLVALAIGFFDACTAVVVKKLSGTEKPITIIFYMAAFALAFAAIPAWFAWQPPTLQQLVLILMIAVTTTVSQIFWVFAWRVGETTAIAPFNYTQLILSACAGYLLFAEIPDAYTWTGAAIIIASTLYITLRESRARKARCARK